MSILSTRLHKKRYHRMLYWFLERHRIHLARCKGLEPPWTQDQVLRNNFFTNPYREHDRVTSWFRTNIRDPMADDEGVLFATAAFRWFNWPPTGALLLEADLFHDWHYADACSILDEAVYAKQKLFSSAYIIKVENGIPKHISVCNQLEKWWDNADRHLQAIEEVGTLEAAHKYVRGIKHLGGFMAYEIVSDLRHTYLLRGAPDIETWCFTGPGAIRGLLRLRGEPASQILRSSIGNRSSLRGSLDDCQYLLGRMREDLEAIMDGSLTISSPGSKRAYKPPYMDLPQLEMREVEHTLCEYDKYERVYNGEGKSKRNYDPRLNDDFLSQEDMEIHYNLA